MTLKVYKSKERLAVEDALSEEELNDFLDDIMASVMNEQSKRGFCLPSSVVADRVTHKWYIKLGLGEEGE